MRKIVILAAFALGLSMINAKAQSTSMQDILPKDALTNEKIKNSLGASLKKGDVLTRFGFNSTSISQAGRINLLMGAEYVMVDNVFGIGSLSIGADASVSRFSTNTINIDGNIIRRDINRYALSPRVLMHFNTGLERLDLYAGVELNNGVSFFDGLPSNSRMPCYNNARIRAVVGASFYLTERFGLFGEISGSGFRAGMFFRF